MLGVLHRGGRALSGSRGLSGPGTRGGRLCPEGRLGSCCPADFPRWRVTQRPRALGKRSHMRCLAGEEATEADGHRPQGDFRLLWPVALTDPEPSPHVHQSP